MFKARLISTLILLPAAIAGILFLPTGIVAIGSGVIFGIAAWEWLHITLARRTNVRFILLAALIIFAASLIIIGINPLWLYYFALMWWLAAFCGICYYPKYEKIWKQYQLQPFAALLMFIPAWLAFNSLHARTNGPIWVLLGCALIWGADIGGYCFGKLWGKTKLIPKVSPNKTWVGLYGGYFTSGLIMWFFYNWFKPQFSLCFAFWLAMITVSFAVIGDLFESMIKRLYGVKDSGKLIPGHGGVFDRVDSMLAAFPVYCLGLDILQNLCAMRF